MQYIFDIALALYYLNPAYTYRLSQSVPPQVILEWRGPGEQPTERAMLDALRLHTELTVSGPAVTVQSAPDVAEVGLLAGDHPFTVPLAEGRGTVTPALPPGVYVVRAADPAQFGTVQAVLTVD